MRYICEKINYHQRNIQHNSWATLSQAVISVKDENGSCSAGYASAKWKCYEIENCCALTVDCIGAYAAKSATEYGFLAQIKVNVTIFYLILLPYCRTVSANTIFCISAPMEVGKAYNFPMRFISLIFYFIFWKCRDERSSSMFEQLIKSERKWTFN